MCPDGPIGSEVGVADLRAYAHAPVRKRLDLVIGATGAVHKLVWLPFRELDVVDRIGRARGRLGQQRDDAKRIARELVGEGIHRGACTNLASAVRSRSP